MNQYRKKAWTTMLAATGILLLSGMAPQAAHAYQIDQNNHVITVAPTGDYTTDAQKALAFLLNRKDKDTLWTFRFQPGKYYLSKPLYGVGLRNVNFVSTADNPAMLIKGDNFSTGEYLVYLRMSDHIKIQGFEFFGRTDFKNNSNPVWKDQGVFFGSCRNILVDNNHFYNFGNSALRVTTSEADPVKGVNSFDTTVSNNTFNNIYQISTTSNDFDHGATARYWLKNNTVVNLRGSVKFASRTTGAQDVHILNNNINGSDHYGLEIDNFDNVEIVGNTLQNIKGIAVNIYTNPKVPKGFNWGSNYKISDNRIHNVRRGIRFSPDPSDDGYKPTPKNLVISNNNLSSITETDKFIPAISVVNGVVNGVRITFNTMSSVTNRKYIGVDKRSTSITQSDNKAEGKALDSQTATSSSPPPASTPQSSPAPSSGGSFNAPSNLVAQYDGKLAVRLTWKDNTNNETGLEVWGSYDGKNYSKIAWLYSDSEVFTHKIKRVPSNPDFYYKVRAVKDQTASSMSNEAKVHFN